jgi:hypothetical protein
MYVFAGRIGAVPEGYNPSLRIEKFKEHRRKRFLTGDELQRLSAGARRKRLASLGKLTRTSRQPSILQREPVASARSAHLLLRRCIYCYSRAVACARFCTSGGNMWTLSEG